MPQISLNTMHHNKFHVIIESFIFSICNCFRFYNQLFRSFEFLFLAIRDNARARRNFPQCVRLKNNFALVLPRVLTPKYSSTQSLESCTREYSSLVLSAEQLHQWPFSNINTHLGGSSKNVCQGVGEGIKDLYQEKTVPGIFKPDRTKQKNRTEICQ